MNKIICSLILFFALATCATNKAIACTATAMVFSELGNEGTLLDTIQPTSLKTKYKKRKKRNWLPKIRLRFLVILFREKLKERNKRKRKPIYPIVDNQETKRVVTPIK